MVVVAALAAAAGLIMHQRNAVDPDTLLRRAEKRIDEGKLNDAVIDLKTVISEDRDNRLARAMLGNLYLEVGHPKGALKELRRARELGATGPEIARGIARALLTTGQFDEAATEIAINGGAEDPEWRVLTGMLDLAQQRLDDARRVFQNVLAQDPDNAEARRGLMQAELSAGNADLARAELETLLAADDADAGLWLLRGELDIHDGDLEAAEASFRKAVALEPDNPLTRIGLARVLVETAQYDLATNELDAIGTAGGDDPRVNFLRARIAEGNNDPNSALQALRKVLQVAPMHRQSLVLAGKLHFARNEFTRAQDYISRLLEIEPKNALAQRMMGAIQLAAGRTDGLASFSEVMEQNDGTQDAGMLALLGTAYLKHGRMDDGQKSLERAVELAPDSLPIRTQLALSHLGAGKPQDAITELQGVLAEDPDFVQARIILALVHMANGDNAAAVETADALVARHPDSALAHNVRGYIGEATGDRGSAAGFFRQAIERDPAFHPARINLARLAIADKNFDEAQKQFDRILELTPFHSFALLGKAAIAVQADKLDEAERLWQLAREHNPDAVAPRLLLSQHYRAKDNPTLAETLVTEAYELAPFSPPVQAQYATIKADAGHYEEALVAARQIVERDPGSVPGLELLARIYNFLGDEGGLVKTLEQIADVAPEVVGARVLLGRLAIRRRNFDEAGQIADAIIAGDENAAAGYELRGDVRAAQGDPEGARAAYLQAFETGPDGVKVVKLDRAERELGVAGDRLSAWLAEHPGDLQVRLVRASLLHDSSSNDAIAEYEKLHQAQGNNPVVLNNLAWLYFEAGRPGALAMAQQAYEIAPQSPEIMDTYGWILFHEGKREQGIDLLDKALQAAPDNPDIAYHNARALHESGQSRQALRLLGPMLEKHAEFPSREDAQTLLAELQKD